MGLLRSLTRCRAMTRKRRSLTIFLILCLGGVYLISKMHYETPKSLPSSQPSQITSSYPENEMNLEIEKLSLVTDNHADAGLAGEAVESDTAVVIPKTDININLPNYDHIAAVDDAGIINDAGIIDDAAQPVPDSSTDTEKYTAAPASITEAEHVELDNSMVPTEGHLSETELSETELSETGLSETDLPETDLPETDVSATQKELNRLDDLYNMDKVKHIDLHNLTFLDNYYYYNYEAIETRISDRMRNIQHICDHTPAIQTGYYNLYRMNELNVTWCPVFKSGSTTWKHFFINKFVKNAPPDPLLGLLKSRMLSSKTRDKKVNGKQTYKNEKDTNIRFTVVRHPLDRIVSHATNSGKDHEMVAQKGIWIQQAMLDSRTPKIKDKNEAPKFKEEFNNYFAWLKDKVAGKVDGVFNHSSDNPYLDPPYPLFPELVAHMMKKRSPNGHWMPAWQFCNICANKFDFIIKLEEEPLELWYLCDKLGKTFWDDRGYFLNRANPSEKKVSDAEKVWDNIKDLTDTQVAYINKQFNVDFNMFDYRKLQKI